MHPRTRAERRHHAARRIAFWRRYRRLHVTIANEPDQQIDSSGRPVDDHWWFQDGRFSTLTLSCNGHHAVCAIEKRERKFRSRKRVVYASLDQQQRAAWCG